MIYRLYGTTGLEVSAIGFGGMRLPADRDEAAALVQAAYDAGINYFDTAIHYPNSEEIFGVAFKEMKKRAGRPFYVATKTFGADEAAVRKDLEVSLKRLGLDCIDFYHIWCVLSPQAWQERKAAGVLQTFEKIKAEGLIRHIAISTHMSGPDIAAALDDYPFAGVLLGYSAMNFAYRESALATAAKHKMAVVAMNPLGGGVIPAHAERFAFVKTRPDETVVEGALRFLLNDQRITVALVGFSSQTQLAEALRSVEGFQPIAAAEIQRIRRSLTAAFDSLCTGCRYCDHCPAGIAVPRIMEAYNHLLLTGKEDAIINRLRWHWGIKSEDAPWQKCKSCGQCESDCTQHLPIMERLREIAKIAVRVAAKAAKS